MHRSHMQASQHSPGSSSEPLPEEMQTQLFKTQLNIHRTGQSSLLG